MGVVQRWKLMQEAEHLTNFLTKGNKLRKDEVVEIIEHCA